MSHMVHQEPPRTTRFRRVASAVQILLLVVVLSTLALWLWLSGAAESSVAWLWDVGEAARDWSHRSFRYPWE